MIPIRQYMLLRITGIVLFAVLTFTIAADLIFVRPAQNELARVTMELAADRAESLLRLQAFQGEQVLRVLRDHAAPALVRHQGSTDLGHIAISQMRNRPFVLAIAFARDDGVGIFINRTGDGYRVRELDSRGGNKRQRWLNFDPRGRPLGGEEFAEREFDARERPWFKSALAAGEDRVVVTDPFVFFESKVPGLTFAVADQQGGATWVTAANVSLSSVSAITSEIKVGESGGIALLTSDGKLIGLPRDPKRQGPPDLYKLLGEPGVAGYGFLARAWETWRAGGPGKGAQSFNVEGRTWLVRMRPLQLRNLDLVAATFAPRDDFTIGTVWDIAAVVALMAGVLLLALIFAHRFSRRFAGVVQSLVAESERMGTLQLDQPVKIGTRIHEIGTLVSAQERMRTLLLDATRNLNERVKELTALHGASRLLQAGRPIDQALLERFAAMLPPAWQFPEICEAQVRYGELVARTSRWRETPWMLSAGFTTRDGHSGAIEVAYLEEHPAAAEGSFVAEERSLIDSMAEMLSAALERQHAWVALEASNRELEARVAARTAELAEREALTRTLYESSPSGLSLATLEGQLRHISPRWTDILGYTLEEAVAMNTRHFWADTREREVFVDTLSKHGQIRNFECRFRRKSGEVFSVLMNASFVEIHGERLITSWAHDITELKATEQALADALQRQNAIFSATPYGICVFEERRFVLASPAFERIFGYAPGEILGQSVRVIYPSDEEFERAGREVYEATRRGEAHSFETAMRHENGSDFWCRVSAAPLVGREAVRGIVALYEDITARKEAEIALRAANEEQDAIFRSATSGIALVRARVILRCNRKLEEIFGYAPGELQGKPTRLWHTSDEEYAQGGGEIYAQLAEARTYRREQQLQRKDGSAFWCRLSGRAVDPEDLGKGSVWMLEDVTAEHDVAEALRAAKRAAEDATQAKSLFLANMSHEIRTPMNGVIGMIDVLHQTSLRGDQMEMVDLIRESAFSLLDIINDILDFSKIESGKLEIEHEALSVADVVEGVGMLMDGMAAKKNVTLTMFVDPNIPVELMGDTLRLRQVLTNLVNNAIKFSSGQQQTGRVSVRALLVDRCPEQAIVELRVADNGIGMDEETQARLFTAFTQADVSTTRRFGGTGLGLSIANQLVELMKGEITVQSAPGAGAVFKVRLPFEWMSETSGAVKASASVSGLSCVVIGNLEGLADDLALYLKHAGAVVERAPNLAIAGKQGLGAGSLSVWITDAEDEPSSAQQMCAAAGAQIGQNVHIVCILIECGERRRPRVVAPELITIDGNALSRALFLRAVAAAAGRGALEADATTLSFGKSPAIAPSREEAVRKGRLILIAEDNETNQKVILRQLTLLGHTADIAADGSEALNSWRTGEYSLVLTDLHMPSMDGYELTAAIRAEEAAGKHVPIVALTANVLKGEADRCRAVGMDDYGSKPIPLAHLKVLLDKWLPIVEPELAAPTPSESVAQTTPTVAAAMSVDIGVLKKLVGDDPAIVREFLHDFRQSASKIAAELRTAFDAKQMSAVVAAAHKLRSSSSATGALALSELCAAMEAEGKTSDFESLVVLLPQFEAEMTVVDAHLAKLLAS